MLSEDQYMERTPDLVTGIRKTREAAEKEMNKFTNVANYDIRRVVGLKPKATPVAGENAVPAGAGSKSPKVHTPSSASQSAIVFPSSPLADEDDQEGA